MKLSIFLILESSSGNNDGTEITKESSKYKSFRQEKPETGMPPDHLALSFVADQSKSIQLESFSTLDFDFGFNPCKRSKNDAVNARF